MNTPRGLGWRALIFGALTVALGIFIIVRLIIEGFEARDLIAILAWVFGIGATVELGSKWRKARRDLATPPSTDPADGERTS